MPWKTSAGGAGRSSRPRTRPRRCPRRPLIALVAHTIRRRQNASKNHEPSTRNPRPAGPEPAAGSLRPVARGHPAAQGRQNTGRRRYRHAAAGPRVLHGHPELGIGGTPAVGALGRAVSDPAGGPAGVRGAAAPDQRTHRRPGQATPAAATGVGRACEEHYSGRRVLFEAVRQAGPVEADELAGFARTVATGRCAAVVPPQPAGR